jgi:hypothetical protein
MLFSQSGEHYNNILNNSLDDNGRPLHAGHLLLFTTFTCVYAVLLLKFFLSRLQCDKGRLFSIDSGFSSRAQSAITTKNALLPKFKVSFRASLTFWGNLDIIVFFSLESLSVLNKNIKLGIYIAPIQPYWADLGAESRVCYPGNTAYSQPQWALKHCYLSQSTASQNEKSTHCHRWGSNLRPSTSAPL